MTHPGVLEVAAIAVPDERSGEAVEIVVVKKDPALTEAALIEHCKKQLTGYKVPRKVVFRSEPLPKTNVGKILRRVIRDEEAAKAAEPARSGITREPAASAGPVAAGGRIVGNRRKHRHQTPLKQERSLF